MRILIILAVVTVVAATLLFTRNANQQTTSSRASQPAPSPGYSARNAELIETGADGLPLYTLHAATIEQHPGADTVELNVVNMRYRDTTGNQWMLRADQGKVTENSSVVNLAGDVQVSGTPVADADLAHFSTEALVFDTRTEIVRTQAPVTVTWSGKRLRADGLTANLKQQRVRLESNVHGLYTR